MKISFYTFLTLCIFIISCATKNNVDTIIYNAKIYTVDSNFTIVEAMAIKQEKIVATGTSDSILKTFNCKKIIDAKGKSIYPGFIDAHTHFLNYGLQLNTVNLMGTTSWENVLVKVAEFSKNVMDTTKWITGRGWDQNDWDNKNFPTNDKLNATYPNNPILLSRVDGHAAIANAKALALAGIQPNQKIDGGTIETINGKLTGVLIDNAVDLVSVKIPLSTKKDKENALLQAQKNCFAVGLTTVDECGLNAEDVDIINDLQKSNALKIKLYVMLSDVKENYAYLFKKGKIETKNLMVNSFKIYGDGALGSRGACLLKHYTDKPNETGFLLSSQKHFDSVANIIYNKGFQMCTHAIGDSTNRLVLNIYAKYLKTKNDLRWRIEHAQIIDNNDFSYFKNYSIIPSVQPTHATSDMYWADKRVGTERIKNGYAYKDLLQQNGYLPLGTDFPVEDISPFKTFYAAVFRKDNNNFPANGYQMENAISKQDAIRGMTIWAAKSNFEETKKGSIEVGKYADFIIVQNDLMNCTEKEILNNTVISTWVNGGMVWGN
jgi:predicted amidohydrolase YtcJ